jgi:hypothetical protein
VKIWTIIDVEPPLYDGGLSFLSYDSAREHVEKNMVEEDAELQIDTEDHSFWCTGDFDVGIHIVSSELQL